MGTGDYVKKTANKLLIKQLQPNEKGKKYQL